MLPIPSHWFAWQSPGVCDAVGVPAEALDVPHAPAVHVALTHSLPPGGHSPAERHCTQSPALSHSVPPFWLQAVPWERAGFDGVPAVQTSLVHWFPSTGKSVLSTTFVTMLPMPSHWLLRQSPGAGSAATVPGVAKIAPHEPAV